MTHSHKIKLKPENYHIYNELCEIIKRIDIVFDREEEMSNNKNAMKIIRNLMIDILQTHFNLTYRQIAKMLEIKQMTAESAGRYMKKRLVTSDELQKMKNYVLIMMQSLYVLVVFCQQVF